MKSTRNKEHAVPLFVILALWAVAFFANAQAQVIDEELAQTIAEMNARFTNVEVELLEWPPELHERLGKMTELAIVTRPLAENTVEDGSKLPLLINLHGGGQRWWDRSLQEQLAVAAEMGMKRGYDLAELSGTPMVVLDPNTGERWNANSLDVMLDYVLEEFPDVDADRVYVMGYSAGGGATWRWINQSADRFAAASPNGFRGASRKDDLTKLVDLPIWAMAGGNDGRNPDGILNTVQRLEAAGNGNVKHTIFEGADHREGGVAVYNTVELVDWMLGFMLSSATTPTENNVGSNLDSLYDDLDDEENSTVALMLPSPPQPTNSPQDTTMNAASYTTVSSFEIVQFSASPRTDRWLSGGVISLLGTWVLL